jgi:hypothetical protein
LRGDVVISTFEFHVHSIVSMGFIFH